MKKHSAKTFWQRLCAVFCKQESPPERERVEDLQREIELLTAHFTDTIYRLRYESMEYDYISPSVQNLLGYTREEIRQIGFRSLIVETRIISEGMKKVVSYDDYEQRRKNGEVLKWQADYLLTAKDGREIWISDISLPWFDNYHQMIGSIGILRDITERVAAENSVREELARLATIDPLTCLRNRRYFFDSLENELKRLERSKGHLAMLLLDVDQFKKINDTHGHSTGDTVLTAIADLMRNCLREIDVCARVGGEEFAVMLIDSSICSAAQVAERMRMTISQHCFRTDGGEQFSCTVSIGVCGAVGGEGRTLQDLYKVADECLYRAKNSGRNRVEADHFSLTDNAAP
jgi:diguanylate cyclase (GGDEF)-like protein/PAS domain S-box-containing protein